MKSFLIKLVVALLLAFAVVCAEQNGERRYAVVINPQGAMVRSSIEPGANRVGNRNIVRGQRLEVLGIEGRLWVKVRTANGDGFVQLTDVEIVEGSLRTSPIGPIVLALVLLAAVGGGAYIFSTKKGLVQKEENEDLA
ncbi:MAG: SH3 domain-containing protein [Chitinivibrionia bacterium]|nr:SH3 domain-containing protein [Chitinivibrionia bacterium]